MSCPVFSVSVDDPPVAEGRPSPRTGAEANAERSRAARLSAILDLLATQGRLSVAETAEHLGVSSATVRRDFTELAHRQLVARNHGGVVATSVAYELPFRYRSRLEDDQLDRIAAEVASLVTPGMVVALNGGTTTTAAARAIAERAGAAAAHGGSVTMVTNALNIASEAVLRPHLQVVSLGGVARPESYEVSGPLAMLMVGQLWFDLAVVGVNAISAHEGATCRAEDEAAIIRAIIVRSKPCIVVTTADKLGARTFASICAADAVDILVTSADEGHAEVLALSALGVDVRCV